MKKLLFQSLCLSSSLTPLQILVNKFAGIGGDIGIERQGADYYLYQKMDKNLYWTLGLMSLTVGLCTINSQKVNSVCTPAIFIPENDASIAYGGANWQNHASNAALYKGFYSRNLATVGTTATWTTPNNTTIVGAWNMWGFGNMGLSLVTIDGDKTRATKLPTAQNLVDSGEAANTILVTNGGYFAPTDRVFGSSTVLALSPSVLQVFADDLTAGVHTVVLTLSGMKTAASSDIRLYITCFFYATDATTLSAMSQGAFPAGSGLYNSVMRTNLQLTSGVMEYALQVIPDGGTLNVLHGNTHGYDNQTALTIKVDGTTVTPVDGVITIGSSSVEITRTSSLKNADTGAEIGVSVTIYTLSPITGITINWTITWSVDATASTACYPAMWILPALLDKGSQNGVAVDTDYSVNDGTYKSQANGNAAYLWDSDGVYAAICNIAPSDIFAATGGLTGGSGWLWIEDRNDATLANKIYFGRAGGDIKPADIWSCKANYRVHKFANANSSLARP